MVSNGFVYLTPLFGGWLADHVLGQRRTVILGAGLMAVGHFMMAFEPLFLLALITLILGNGAFYSIFYVGINVGRVPRAARLRHARRKAGLAL
jgi:proton-dependent oligopeptide transporter, POT family